MPNPTIVHFLRTGRTPCEMRGEPRDWPDGHKWSDSWQEVTCAVCQASRVENVALAAAGVTDANRYGGEAARRLAFEDLERIRLPKAEGGGIDGHAAGPTVVPLIPVRDAHGALAQPEAAAVPAVAVPETAGAQAGEKLSASPPNVPPGRACGRCGQVGHLSSRELGIVEPAGNNCRRAMRGEPPLQALQSDGRRESDSQVGIAWERLTRLPAMQGLAEIVDILATVAPGLPEVLVRLTDLEAAAPTPADQEAAKGFRSIAEALLPVTKAAIRVIELADAAARASVEAAQRKPA